MPCLFTILSASSIPTHQVPHIFQDMFGATVQQQKRKLDLGRMHQDTRHDLCS